MKVNVKVGDLTKTPADLLAVNLFEGVRKPGGATGAVDQMLGGLLSEQIQDEKFEGKEGQALFLHTHDKIPAKRVLLVGLGEKEEFSTETVRRAAGVTVKKAKEVGAKRIASVLHGAGIGGLSVQEAVEAMTEGALLADYQYVKHKSAEEQRKVTEKAIGEFTIVERAAEKVQAAEIGVREGVIDAEATIYARDLVNEPSSHLTPKELANEARKMAGPGIAIKVLNREESGKLGMDAFLGVARGSDEEPQFIHLTYKPTKAKKYVVIVGKGITFDTGGVQLKDRKGMMTMKMDMAGAAAVLGVFRALRNLTIPVEVHGLVAATENMPSGRAIKPGDIVRAMNGKTIEVEDTDAEGRLTLADALSFAVTLKPDAIIDLATLTGSCIAGLGEQVAGLLTNHREVAAAIYNAAESAGEKVWELPLAQDYKETIKSKVADLKNVGGREGDVIKAALFLEEFVGCRPWAHLDIAGPAFAEKEFNSYTGEGGTGFGVRTLLHYLRAL